MTTTLYGLSAFGGLAVLLGMAAACLFGFSFAREEARAARERRDRDVRREAVREVGHWLCSDCVWFSEDPAAAEAVRALGENLRDLGGTAVSTARDRWRKVVAGEKNKATIKEWT